MRVVRFMSDAEKEMFLSGAKLMNCDKHEGMATCSVGFCFAELTDERDADKWLRKLLLLTDAKWCIEFDTAAFEEPLTKSAGVYSDDNDFHKRRKFREWCTTKYSLATHPYVRIGKCPDVIGVALEKKIEWEAPI